MRQLSDSEREVVIKDLETKGKSASGIMRVFRGFGLIQMVATLCLAFFGDVPKGDIPFLLMGCVLLYLVYFTFTGWVVKKNQWNQLLTAVKSHKEYVVEGELLHVYKERNNSRTKACMLNAAVECDGKTIQCRAAKVLEHTAPGTKIGVVALYEKVEYGWCYAAIIR